MTDPLTNAAAAGKAITDMLDALSMLQEVRRRPKAIAITPFDFSDMKILEIRRRIVHEITAITKKLKDSGRCGLLAVCVPSDLFQAMGSMYVGDSAELTLIRCIEQDNAWVHARRMPVVLVEEAG